MPKEPRTLTITDPRTFDGDPFEVAERAVAQCIGLIVYLIGSVEDAVVMARNAEMERNLQDSDDPGADGWATGAQASRWEALLGTLRACKRQLEGLGRAASYNPRNPPKS